MTGHEITGKRYFLEREGYHSYLLNYTLDGCARVEYNGKTYTLKAGDLLFIDCNRHHKVESDDSGWEFYYLHCNGPALPELYAQFLSATGNVLHNFSADVFLSELSFLHEKLDNYPKLLLPEPTDIDERLFTEFSERVFKVLNDIWLQINSRHEDKNTYPPYVHAAQEFIRAHYTEKITLSDIAAATFISPWRLAHQFKQCTGSTIGDTIADLRLKKAVELLSTTDKKIIEIAVLCGYGDSQMLNRIIQQNYSLTPKQLRKTVKNGENVIGKIFHK